MRALSSVQILFHNFLARGLQHLTTIVKVLTRLCFVLANLATVVAWGELGSKVSGLDSDTVDPVGHFRKAREVLL